MTQPAPPPHPQHVPGAARPGELLDRFLARLVDGVLLAVAFGVVSAVARSLFLHGFLYSRGELFLYAVFTYVVTTVLQVGYFAYLESERGATLGKQLLHLRVVGPDGSSRPTLEQGVRRNLWMAVGLVGIVPFVGGGLAALGSVVAVITIAVGIANDTAGRQACHDRFAGGTRVLKID